MGSSSGFMTSNGIGPVSTMLSGSGKIQGFATTGVSSSQGNTGG
jgi:hypothetical protein